MFNPRPFTVKPCAPIHPVHGPIIGNMGIGPVGGKVGGAGADFVPVQSHGGAYGRWMQPCSRKRHLEVEHAINTPRSRFSEKSVALPHEGLVRP